MTPRRAHVIGSGGGNRGSLHPLIYERIVQDAEIVGFDGSSISAVHGYAVGTDHVDQIRPLWEGVRQQSDFMRRTWLTPLNGLHTLNPLRKLLTEQRWGRVRRSVAVGVFWWAQARHALVTLRGRDLRRTLDYVIASCSIMVMHDRIEIGGRLVGDGGHHSPIPVRPLHDTAWLADVDEVHVLLCRPITKALPKVEPRKTDGPIEMFLRFADYATHRALLSDLDLLRRWAKRRPDVPFWIYAPRDWDIAGPTFEADAARLRLQIADRIEHGQHMADHRVRLE